MPSDERIGECLYLLFNACSLQDQISEVGHLYWAEEDKKVALDALRLFSDLLDAASYQGIHMEVAERAAYEADIADLRFLIEQNLPLGKEPEEDPIVQKTERLSTSLLTEQTKKFLNCLEQGRRV